MSIELHQPGVGELGAVAEALREWQSDTAPMQLHPGDLGWFWRFGAETTAAAVRTWSRDGRILAVGLLDGPDLLRMTLAPEVYRDEDLGLQLAADIADPGRGVLPAGKVDLEAPRGALVSDLLAERGWRPGEAWTPLRFDLAEPVQVPDLRIEVVGHDQVPDFTAVVRSAFNSSTFTDERWHAVAAGPLYTDARCLLAYDDQGNAVATVTVWSAGPGRPGLIEPMGVHQDHRGRGHGRAINIAAAAQLRDLGASSAIVCTPSENLGGVAAYRSAGFQALPQIGDITRTA